jgi:hypothetical protein
MSSWDRISTIIQAVTAGATAALFFVAWLQIRSLRKQVTTALEDGLTAQYRRIMEYIPVEIWLDHELKELRDDKRRNDSRDAIYRYIDLSQEQAFLHDVNRVSDETWIEWSKGIKFNMELKAFRGVWEEVSEKYPNSFGELRALLK